MNWVLNLLFYSLRLVLLITTPFLIFVKSAVLIHTKYEYPTGLTIGLSLMILAVILFLYVTLGYSMLFNKIGSGNALKQRFIFMLIVSGGILMHLLFFISNKHMKSDDLKGEFTDLHPIIRIATGVLTKIDKDLVVTDISRSAEDYGEMGLKENKRSLHYPQKDGYAYALDLRTKGKSTLSIALMTYYYKLLGFNTLRHVGTADHLHIALYCPSRYRR